jgi:hypothetical protein
VKSDDAKTAPECFEYILVHELVHLLEPTHNARFAVPMDLYLPHWQHLRRQLNQLRSATRTGLTDKLKEKGALAAPLRFPCLGLQWHVSDMNGTEQMSGTTGR